MTLSFFDISPASFPAGEALVEHRVVAINSAGAVVYADAGTPSIGVTLDTAASGEMVAVKLWSQGGTFPVTCAEAVTKGTRVYQTTDGKVTDTAVGSTISLGTVNEAATADGAQVEMVPDSISFIPRTIIHTVTAGEDTANAAVIDTGLGALLRNAVVQVRTAAGVERASNTVTHAAGVVTVANSALAATDIIIVVPIV